MDHILRENLEQYLTALKDERGLQFTTIKSYKVELENLLQLLREPSTLILRNKLRRLAPATQWRKLVIWRSFLRTVAPPWRDLLENFKTPKLSQKQPIFLTEEEAFRLEAVCYKSKQMARDRLFIGFALQLGLRLSEILSLKFSDIEAGGWLRLTRKGNKEQRLPLTQTLQTLIHFWKSESAAQGADWIFHGRSTESLSPRAAQILLKNLAKKAGIEKHISPHSLRHTFATTLASRGANLAALKELLGHEKISTTERYLHVTPQHLRETLSLLQVKTAQPLIH